MQYLDSVDRSDPRRQRQPGVSLPAPEQGSPQPWLGGYEDPQPWSSASRWQVCDAPSRPGSDIAVIAPHCFDSNRVKVVAG